MPWHLDHRQLLHLLGILTLYNIHANRFVLSINLLNHPNVYAILSIVQLFLFLPREVFAHEISRIDSLLRKDQIARFHFVTA